MGHCREGAVTAGICHSELESSPGSCGRSWWAGRAGGRGWQSWRRGDLQSPVLSSAGGGTSPEHCVTLVWHLRVCSFRINFWRSGVAVNEQLMCDTAGAARWVWNTSKEWGLGSPGTTVWGSGFKNRIIFIPSCPPHNPCAGCLSRLEMCLLGCGAARGHTGNESP